MKCQYGTGRFRQTARRAGLLFAGVAFVLLSAPPLNAAENVGAFVNGQRHSAERLQEHLWHVVTQDAWPATLSLELEWFLQAVSLAGDQVAPYECTAASIGSDDPSFKQDGAPMAEVVGESDRRYRVAVSGVKTNRSVVKAEFYTAKLSCFFRKANQEKVNHTFQTVIRVDANATASFDPGLPENQFCVEFLTPREGDQVPLADGNKLTFKSRGWDYMFLRVERAAKLETEVHGDLSLPAGQVYGSEWTVVLDNTYELPKAGKTLYLRVPSTELTKGGLYRANVWCMDATGLSVGATPVSPWIQYRVGSEMAAMKHVSGQVPVGSVTQVGQPGIQGDARPQMLMAPRLQVKSVAVHPVPLKAGTPVNLEIAFENKGGKASAPEAKYRLACTVLSGGPECPVPSGDRAIGKGIEPGQTGSAVLLGAKPAEAGEYRVSVAVPPDQPGRPHSITLKVPSPARKTVVPPGQPPFQRPQTPPVSPPPDNQKPDLRKLK